MLIGPADWVIGVITCVPPLSLESERAQRQRLHMVSTIDSGVDVAKDSLERAVKLKVCSESVAISKCSKPLSYGVGVHSGIFL